jgi:hypothetical protein
MKLTWKKSTAEFGGGENLYLGSIKVVSVFYDGVAPATETNREKVTYHLPSLRNPSNFKSRYLAKRAAEIGVLDWLTLALTDQFGYIPKG